MKVPLRILVILVSIGILVYAALPPGPQAEPERQQAPDPGSDPSGHSDSNLIRDFLGGAQLDQGRKARQILQEVDASNREEIGELEQFDSE